jgi:molybdenum cofactor guanylyltransferase
MKRHLEVSAFILAGGVSSRMGRDKALLPFGNEPLIRIIARLLEAFVRDVTVIGPPERYGHLRVRVLPDRLITAKTGESLQTPLLGIATALSASGAPWNLILACDLPYLTPEWVDWLLGRAERSSAQILIPRTLNGIEPLAAVYRRECLTQILEGLGKEMRSVKDAISRLQIEVCDEAGWASLDPNHRVLKNMNTAEDYQEAKKWLEKHPGT